MISFVDDTKLRIVVCWTHLSGYMAACWHALRAYPRVELRVIAFADESQETCTAYDASLVAGLDCHLLSPAERGEPAAMAAKVRELVADFRPDVVIIAGWAINTYVRLARDPAFDSSLFFMMIDTQWLGTLRQRLGRFKIAGLLSRIDLVIGPGERTFQFARRIGIPEKKIRRGMYSVDFASLRTALDERLRASSGWPRRFLYVGRYVDVKAIDVLLAAYRRYRQTTPEPWPLACCGSGPWQEQIRQAEGVEDLGFVQPRDLPSVFARHGVFVLASRYEPWGLVVAEAAAAGLPVVCSEACGAGADVVRSYWNGIAVETGSVSALAAAFVWCHNHASLLPEFGRRGQSLAAPFSAEAWADRIVNYIDELRCETRLSNQSGS